jgi:hypothetical protein
MLWLHYTENMSLYVLIAYLWQLWNFFYYTQWNTLESYKSSNKKFLTTKLCYVWNNEKRNSVYHSNQMLKYIINVTVTGQIKSQGSHCMHFHFPILIYYINFYERNRLQCQNKFKTLLNTSKVRICTTLFSR